MSQEPWAPKRAWREAPLGVRLAYVFLKWMGFTCLFALLVGSLGVAWAALAAGSVEGSVREGVLAFALSLTGVMGLLFGYALMRACNLLAEALIQMRGDHPEQAAGWVREWLGELIHGAPRFAMGFAGVQMVAAGVVQSTGLAAGISPATLTLIACDVLLFLGMLAIVEWRKGGASRSAGRG